MFTKKFPIMRLLLIAALFFVFTSTSSWRTEHGLSFSTKRVKGPETELIELNKTIIPTIERRGIIRSQLINSLKRDAELEKKLSSQLAKYDDAKRTELREQFEARSLSDENMQSPETMQLYAMYVEANELQRHTDTLRKQLAAYEYQLTQALAQRDRLQVRVDSIQQLGFDPENGTIDNEENFEMFEKLASLRDATSSKLTVADVVGHNDDSNNVADRVFPSVKSAHKINSIAKNVFDRMRGLATGDTADAVKTYSDASLETSDALTKQIDDLAIKRQFGPFERTIEFITNDDGSVTKIESGIIGDREINFLTNFFDEIRNGGWHNCMTIVIITLIVISIAVVSSTLCRFFRILTNITLCIFVILLAISATMFLV